MYQQLQRACTAIVLLIKPFRLLFGCRRRRGFLLGNLSTDDGDAREDA